MSGSQKTVGVLGGMGPDATVDFMARVIALTEADRDQDHVRMLIDHNPHVPNRQKAILAEGEDPGPVLAEMAARLEANGADFLVIPCNTAYAFEDAILAATSIPLISNVAPGAQYYSAVPGRNIVVVEFDVSEDIDAPAGTLDVMLGRMADAYEDEVDAGVRGLVALIEPLLIIFLGFAVIIIALAILLPYWNIGDLVE